MEKEGERVPDWRVGENSYVSMAGTKKKVLVSSERADFACRRFRAIWSHTIYKIVSVAAAGLL